MSYDPISSLHEDALAFIDLARQQRRRLPRIRIEVIFDAGDVCVQIYVEGEIVVVVTGASLESAARKARLEFEGWANDQELSIANALEISGREARRDRAAGLGR